MPENFCQDRAQPVDPIDQEAHTINRFLQDGDRLSASARLREDLTIMGPTQFMSLVGETKALADLNHSRTHIEITPLSVPGDPCDGKIDVSLVTPGRDLWGRPVLVEDPVVRIDNRENYQLPRTVPCEPVPPPTVPCEPPPVQRYPAPWEQPPRLPHPIEQPCPPHGGNGGLNIDIDLVFKNIFGHKGNDDRDHRYEPNRYDPRRNEEPRRYDDHGARSGSNHGDGNVIVNNYNTVNVKGGDSNSSSNSNSNSHADSHAQKPDPHKKVEHHR